MTGELVTIPPQLNGQLPTGVYRFESRPDSRRKKFESELRKANDRKDNLGERAGARSGAAAFRLNLDAEQLAAQIATLTAARAAVVAHQATLP